MARPDRSCSRSQQPGMLPCAIAPRAYFLPACPQLHPSRLCLRLAYAGVQTWGGQRSRSRLTAAAMCAWREAAPRSCVSAFRHRRLLRRTLRGAQAAMDAVSPEVWQLHAHAAVECSMFTLCFDSTTAAEQESLSNRRATSQPLASAEGDAQLQHGPARSAAAAATEQRPAQQQGRPPQEGDSERGHQPSAADQDRLRQQEQQQAQQQQQQQQRRPLQQQPRPSDEGPRQQERPRPAVQPRTLSSGAREDDKQVRGSAQHAT